VLVTHAEAALQHANAAEKENLNAAIETGKQGHADVATEHAQEALTHLEAAKDEKRVKTARFFLNAETNSGVKRIHCPPAAAASPRRGQP
jgi:hypothetical protein